MTPVEPKLQTASIGRSMNGRSNRRVFFHVTLFETMRLGVHSGWARSDVSGVLIRPWQLPGGSSERLLLGLLQTARSRFDQSCLKSIATKNILISMSVKKNVLKNTKLLLSLKPQTAPYTSRTLEAERSLMSPFQLPFETMRLESVPLQVIAGDVGIK